ncbi:MAG: hypothetical protein HUU28_11395 [Planctomycetaceae bacterium]|nr:hypothetical protein [Planctomycetaceae bacterium]
MNFELKNLIDQIAKAPARTKLVTLLSIAAVIAVFVISGWVSGQPHFVKLYSDLSDAERVAVEKALSGAEVRYRISDFPGPFVVYVDEPQYDKAQFAVAMAEALRTTPKGIDTAGAGAGAIFLSAGERQQTMQKREWQETERLLEQLDFVTDATVTTSMPDSSPLRAQKPIMVSVALQLKGTGELAADQASNVAKLVRYRFAVPAENVVITDQSGRTLFDPTHAEGGQDPRELLVQSEKYDRELASKANKHIENAFGPRKALVTVTSQWNYDHSTTVDEKIDPETVAIQVDTKETSAPVGALNATGGAAGVSSNTPNEFGNETTPVPNETSGAATAAAAGSTRTKDNRTTYEASRTRTETVRTTPRLERMSVALVIDESLASKKAEIQKIVEAAVGFDSGRQDTIGVTTTSLSVPEVIAADGTTPDGAAPAEAPAEEPGLSPMVEVLLERGVEIVSALAFLGLLATSLKGSKKGATPAAAGHAPALAGAGAAGGSTGLGGASSAMVGADGTPVDVDPEVLARAQIEELVRTDPRRVGEILSRWVDEKATAKA